MKITDLLNKDAIKLNGIANSKQDTIKIGRASCRERV